MKYVSLIYNGHIAMATGTSWVSNPMRAAWTFCTLSTILYALTIFSIVSVVGERVMRFLPFSERLGQLIIIVAIVLLSDLGGNNYWFGARPTELDHDGETRAKRAALTYSVTSYIVFLSVNILLFAQF